MENWNWPEIRRDLLIHLRGPLSQMELSRKMGSQSNQVYRWESGQSALSWSEFASICRTVGAPFERACRYAWAFPENEDPADGGKIIRHLSGPRLQEEIASLLRVSEAVVSRWLGGKSEPSLELVLRLAAQSAQSLPAFLDCLTGGVPLPAIGRELELQARERELHFDRPWIAALLLVLISDDYKTLEAHQDDFLAGRLGVSVAQVRKALQDLLLAGAIYRDEKGLFKTRLRRINVAGQREGNLRIRRYWTKRLSALLEPARPRCGTPLFWPYMVFSTDQESYARIQKKLHEVYEEIQIVSQADSGSGELYLFNAQMLNLRQLPSLPEGDPEFGGQGE